jgi:hypothetical protein
MRNSVRDTASDLVMTAMNFLGVPYRRAAVRPRAGLRLQRLHPPHLREQHRPGAAAPRRPAGHERRPADVHRDELKPGDLVFFNTMRRAFSHVGIYVGDGKFIHSPRTGGHVRVEDMREAYWAKRFNGARRADRDAAARRCNHQALNPGPPCALRQACRRPAAAQSAHG